MQERVPGAGPPAVSGGSQLMAKDRNCPPPDSACRPPRGPPVAAAPAAPNPKPKRCRTGARCWGAGDGERAGGGGEGEARWCCGTMLTRGTLGGVRVDVELAYVLALFACIRVCPGNWLQAGALRLRRGEPPVAGRAGSGACVLMHGRMYIALLNGHFHVAPTCVVCNSSMHYRMRGRRLHALHACAGWRARETYTCAHIYAGRHVSLASAGGAFYCRQTEHCASRSPASPP